jgi:membrane protease YdiL (CAAX protease family)
MPTRTLFLDSLILASVAFPSGFSGSLCGVLRIEARRVSTAFLVLMLAPFVIVVSASLSVRADMFLIRSPHAWVIGLALVAAPATLALEWGVHSAVALVRSGIFQHGIELHDFWQGRRSVVQFGLLTLIALGEEIVFRQTWIGVLEPTFGFSALAALITSAVMYGINHLYFGWSSVLSKTAAGLVYGGLFLLDDRSLWCPFLAHALQNAILLGVSAKRNG